MAEPLFTIGATGVDADGIVAEVRAAVAEKMARGAYSDAWIARAECMNLSAMRDEEYLDFYLDCLRGSTAVDIGDYQIVERRARFAPLLVAVKRTIWKLLRFYTYRLWSQQNQVNELMFSTVEALDQRYRRRIEELERRVAELQRPKADA
jgi:hypothetical protein